MDRIKQMVTAVDARLSAVIQDIAPNLNSYMLIFLFTTMALMIGHFFNTGIYWLVSLLTVAYIFVHRVNEEILDRYDATVHELFVSDLMSRLAELVMLAGIGTSPAIDPRIGFAALIAYMMAFFSGFYTEIHFDTDRFTFSAFRPSMFHIIIVAAAIAIVNPQAIILGLVAIITLFFAAVIQDTTSYITPVAIEDDKEA